MPSKMPSSMHGNSPFTLLVSNVPKALQKMKTIALGFSSDLGGKVLLLKISHTLDQDLENLS